MKTACLCVVLALFVGCKESRQLVLITKCGNPCYTHRIGQPGVGQCDSGYWSCIDGDEDSAECVGEVGPSRELCDGVDNNCDGRVDEGATAFCVNECGVGKAACVDGKPGACSARTPSPEVCDGVDNDCDGLIDEPTDLPVEFCYTGPAGSASYGTCHPGSSRCEFGKKVCSGEKLPAPEACNGLDDDCDGRIDNGVTSSKPSDVVFILDNSPSMQSTINSVQAAANSFATTYAMQADLRWALVVAPDKDPRYDGQVRRWMDFNTSQVFNSSMQVQMATGGSSEPTLDAISMLLDTTNPLHMSWRAGSRHVLVLFTDEVSQSYSSPITDSASVHAQFMSLTNVNIWIFTSQEQNWSDAIFQGVSVPGSGIRYLSTDPANILSDLNNIIEKATCE